MQTELQCSTNESCLQKRGIKVLLLWKERSKIVFSFAPTPPYHHAKIANEQKTTVTQLIHWGCLLCLLHSLLPSMDE